MGRRMTAGSEAVQRARTRRKLPTPQPRWLLARLHSRAQRVDSRAETQQHEALAIDEPKDKKAAQATPRCRHKGMLQGQAVFVKVDVEVLGFARALCQLHVAREATLVGMRPKSMVCSYSRAILSWSLRSVFSSVAITFAC